MNYPLYSDTLCLDIWNKDGENYVMKPEIRKDLLQIAQDFIKEDLKDAKITIGIKDVVIIGSSVNYNWTPYSDIDLHILVDFSELDMSEQDAEAFLGAIKANWNKKHHITIKGHDLEIYVQGISQKVDSSAAYSIKNGKWIKPPIKNRPSFNKELIKKKHKDLKARIDAVINDRNEEELRKILEKLFVIRQAGLDKKGEFSEENIVFKILRAQGYLDKLKDYIVKIYDKERSISELSI
jgi:predicted nucleotidyltransferase